MTEKNEKFPDPREIEKEISELLSEKFGGRVKLISPVVIPREASFEKDDAPPKTTKINFSLKPAELQAYLDQYIVKQDEAKSILATKVCTHFNRIKCAEDADQDAGPVVGNIKNNILMIGPTGVGKTYIIKLIAQKIGVPFVKGDATKFSETGYVGGDVEDLVRDLVREADQDMELAQYGIIYIDEIDKIAASHNLVGPDVSRTGVQRALLKPMEETDVDLKVSHDPISMLEEIERYRKTGKRKKQVVNTKNILFIMSGAFNELAEIIKRRMVDQGIGFGASIKSQSEPTDYLRHVKPEDLVAFGFESEFIGRLPVISVFEKLTEEDLYAILQNLNNPIIFSKKLDFKAYGIDIKFEDRALKALAHLAYNEGTGARGLVSAVEKVLLKFENKLPSTDIKQLPVIHEVVLDPEGTLQDIVSMKNLDKWEKAYENLFHEEKRRVESYLEANLPLMTDKYDMAWTPSRIDLIAEVYATSVSNVDNVMRKTRDYYDQVKNMESYFYKNHDLNVTLDEQVIDDVILQMHASPVALGDFYKGLTTHFKYGLNLIRDKTGKDRFVVTKEALEDPEEFLNSLVKKTYAGEPSP